MSSDSLPPCHIAMAIAGAAMGAFAAYKYWTKSAVDEYGREVPTQVSRTAADAVIIRPKKKDGDRKGHEILLITRLKKTF